MIIKWTEGNGVVHEWEWSGSPRVQEGRWIKERTGWSTTKFLEALGELDPDAIIALVIIMSAREGRKLKWDDVDLDPINDLDWIPTEDELQKMKIQEAVQGKDEKKTEALPPAQEPRLSDVPSSTGHPENGHLAKAGLSLKSEPTALDSGHASD